MNQTTVVLPPDLKQRAEEYASKKGISLETLIRDALQAVLSPAGCSAADDPLFANYRPFDGDAPSDLSVNHDDYLYGPEQ